MSNKRAVHLTSAHERSDIRIFLKECVSLASAGWDVTLLVADGGGDEVVRGVAVVDVGRPSGRLSRMTRTPSRLLARALAIDAAVYHLHDPELLHIGWLLKRRGKLVIFDSHEDVPKDILGKTYLKEPLRKVVAEAYTHFERFCCSRFDAVVTATPSIRAHFEPFQAKTVDINNFPMESETITEAPSGPRSADVAYVGGINRERGVVTLVDAMHLVTSEARLLLIGEFMGGTELSVVSGLPGWSRVSALGRLDRRTVGEHLAHVAAGIVTFLPEPNHVTALPNKLFEYMAAGVAVIASDFELWRSIVEGHDCGICVDPRDPRAIAAAIDVLVSDPERAARCGANGLRAVREHYNWPTEEAKLLELYRGLTS